MMTINEQANREIVKAKKALDKAISLLMDEPGYWNNKDIFHDCTVNECNRLITALELLND